MGQNSLTPQQQAMLMQMAEKKLGISQEQLRQKLESGQIQELLNQPGMQAPPNLAALLGNKNALEQLLNSPQAQELLRKLKEGQ